MRKLLAVLIAATAGASANSVQLHPAADSVLEIKGSRKKALLHFDLAAVPAGNTIVAARLALTLEGAVRHARSSQTVARGQSTEPAAEHRYADALARHRRQCAEFQSRPWPTETSSGTDSG